MAVFVDYLVLTIDYDDKEKFMPVIKAIGRRVYRKNSRLVINVKRELFIEALFSDFGKVSRLDLAIDLPFKPECGVEADVTITGRCGITYYFGSRRSDRFCRVYDKAAQLALDRTLWRIEYEIKGRLCNSLSQFIRSKRYERDVALKMAFCAVDRLGFSKYIDVSEQLEIDSGYVSKRYNWNRIAKALVRDNEAMEIVLKTISEELSQVLYKKS